MEVYAEYAFAENFLIDAMLLYVTFRCTRTPARVLPIVLASSFGAAFAVLYALLSVPYALSLFVKIAAGGVMCLLARTERKKSGLCGRNKAQKLRRFRSFAGFLAVFFTLSACLCGVFYAVDATGKALKAWQIPVCVFFVFACEAGAKRLFKAQKTARFTRDCVLYAGDGSADGKKGVPVRGFIDSGNRAVTPEGVPICFVPPETAFSLIDETVRMRDFCITTVGGGKKIKIFRGKIQIYERNGAHKIKRAYFCEVYFSISAHLSGNRVLLPADCLNGTDEPDGSGEEENVAAETAVSAAEKKTENKREKVKTSKK
ncbi:MAG: sigma-E processing peptidase SpoIIGA [Candidatus Scatosoma sp.]